VKFAKGHLFGIVIGVVVSEVYRMRSKGGKGTGAG
jgi:hypothetical protein